MNADAGARGTAERTVALRALGVPDAALAELADYVEHPYAGAPADATPLPLPDEPHLAVWGEYAAEAAVDGAVAVLRRRLVQMRFPIAAGIGADAAYRAAVLRGTPPPAGGPAASFVDESAVELAIHATPAGHVPVLVARQRPDFETLVRVLTARNEPVAVPASMGACLVKGLVNQDRVARHRARWLAMPGNDESTWQGELRRLSADKAAYQDRLIVLSAGPYSGVAAAELGKDAAAWEQQSLPIRRDHECFHYLTLRRFGLIRSNALDEVVADCAGLLAAYGEYDPRLARRCLGIDEDGSLRAGGRLEVYCGELSAAARAALAPLVAAAIAGTARHVDAAGAPADEAGRGALLLRLAARGLLGLAAHGAR